MIVRANRGKFQTLVTGLRTPAWPTRLLEVALFVGWAAIVLYTARHHEFWRDEVRALSLALQADGLWSIPSTVHGEGHPALWYFLLKVAYDLFHTKAVLPIVSIAVAAAAVAIFLARAPMPLWWKALFVFCGIPLYEYSVMARNYGISMLLMFVFAAFYTAPTRSWFCVGISLFLLAQTNVIAALFVPLFMAIWFLDWLDASRRGALSPGADLRVALGMAFGAIGILVAFLTVYPTHLGLVTDATIGKKSFAQALVAAIFSPGQYYRRIGGLGQFPTPIVTVLLYAAASGLVRWPSLFLAALGGIWGSSLFFGLVYPSSGYRHEAVWFVFMITLYWIGCSTKYRPLPERRRLVDWAFPIGLYLVMPLMLAINIILGFVAVKTDIDAELSKSEAIGALLQSSPLLRNAIVLAEPEFVAEGVPYYADNDIYLIREGKFGKIASWSRGTKIDLSLGDILEASKTLKAQTGKPIVILMQFPLDAKYANNSTFVTPFGWRFSFTDRELRDFMNATRRLPMERDAVTDENVDVYLFE